jgi:uncharacterized protein (DUF2342 family)
VNFYRAVRAVADASGDGPIDWGGVGESSKAATAPGDLDISSDEIEGYRDDVCAARDRVRAVGGIDFDLPESIEVQHRHHWIDANIGTFERILRELDTEVRFLPGIVRTVNTGSMAVSISFLANNVLGQYDPLLLSQDEEHALYFVHPNIERIADRLSVDLPRFRRWIAFHEVTHAAEFGTAPWLTDHLEGLIEEVISDISSGQFNRGDFKQIDVTMTAVEGYAELLMDQTFDAEYEDLRRKLDERRQGGRPITQLMRHLLGLTRKRRQYERGKDFFETVANTEDVQTAGLVWDREKNLPTDEELDNPSLWLTRMGV